jgi:hypothetical protein
LTALPQVVLVQLMVAVPRALRSFTEGLPLVWHKEQAEFAAWNGRLCCGATAWIGCTAQ